MQFVWHTVLSALPAVKLYFLSVLCFGMAEFAFPAERGQPFRNHFANLQHDLLFYFVTPFALILPTALLAGLTQRFHGGFLRLDLNHIGIGVAAIDWPLRNLLLPFVPLLVFDFFYYWHHRLQHTVPTFWAIHRLHHTTESLNALAAFRIHWLEEPMRVFTMSIPMAVFFNISAVQGAWIAFALAQLATMIHCNVRIPFGPFTKILAGPQLHRLHHSYAPEHLDRNYAAIFPLWDVLFGTYVAPKRGEWPVTGLRDNEHPGSVVYETVFPFLAWGRAAGRWVPRVSPARGDKQVREAL